MDVWDRHLMRTRRWAWLRCLIHGLCNAPQSYGPTGEPVPATRVQALLASRRTPQQ